MKRKLYILFGLVFCVFILAPILLSTSIKVFIIVGGFIIISFISWLAVYFELEDVVNWFKG